MPMFSLTVVTDLEICMNLLFKFKIEGEILMPQKCVYVKYYA